MPGVPRSESLAAFGSERRQIEHSAFPLGDDQGDRLVAVDLDGPEADSLPTLTRRDVEVLERATFALNPVPAQSDPDRERDRFPVRLAPSLSARVSTG